MLNREKEGFFICQVTLLRDREVTKLFTCLFTLSHETGIFIKRQGQLFTKAPICGA